MMSEENMMSEEMMSEEMMSEEMMSEEMMSEEMMSEEMMECGCLIATAAFGRNGTQVQSLREVRDNIILDQPNDSWSLNSASTEFTPK